VNHIAIASGKNREELFTAVSQKMCTKAAIVEKDFWVVWVLDKIFGDDRLNKILMFKGGTSLSKVFNLIGRFSEDIDLILDWREIAKENPLDKRASKNQQVKFNKKVNDDAKVYIKETLLPIIIELVSPLCSCSIDQNDEFNINIIYPSSFSDEYLRPDIFEKSICKINAIVAKRIFWEKATILHQESNRVKEKVLLPRYSRHYYDMTIMAQSTVKQEALDDLELLEQVIDFKNKFYPANWAKFDEAKPNTLKLIPPDFRLNELKKDYKAMEHMIFDKHLKFEEIIETLQALEDEINSLEQTDD